MEDFLGKKERSKQIKMKPFIEIEGRLICTTDIQMVVQEDQNNYFNSTLNAYWLHIYMKQGGNDQHFLYPTKEKRDTIYRRMKEELILE